MPTAAFVRQRLALDFASLKHASPDAVYVAPVPDHPLRWAGVLFVRKGPYANAILRFQIDFPPTYPAAPPVVKLLTDVFHPLVVPLTTYTYGVRDSAAEPVSAADRDRLPPGGLSLRHGFPEWFGERPESHSATDVCTLEVMQYLRVVFDTEAVLDAATLDTAANQGAWHAWRAFRSHAAAVTGNSPSASPALSAAADRARSALPLPQPGGARRPGEWNWQGVWEDRVRKSVRASIADNALFGGDTADPVRFSKIEAEAVREAVSWLGSDAAG